MIRRAIVGALICLSAQAQVFGPAQEANLRSRFLSSTGGFSGELIFSNSTPADRIIGRALTELTEFISVRGITVGSNSLTRAGSIRWNPWLGSLQVHNGTNWVSAGGSGFPLYDDGDARGHSITNGYRFAAQYGLFQYLGIDGARPYAYLQAEPGGFYSHQYGIRDVTNFLDVIACVAATNMTDMYPGKLVYYEGNGNTYRVNAIIFATNYVTFTTNAFPVPSVSTNYTLFVARGPVGGAGANGAAGANGLGNVQYSIWNSAAGYVYDTGTPVVVSRSGRWYDCVASSTNQDPTGAGATNYWAISIDKGQDGTLAPTNMVLRGEWNSGEVYTNFDAVTRGGNLFWIPGTGTWSIGQAPAADASGIGQNSAYWLCLVQRGSVGAAGAAGADGAVTYFTNILQYIYNFDTNFARFTNNPSAASNMLYCTGVTNGTNYFQWAPEPVVQSNAFYASNNPSNFLSGASVGTSIVGFAAQATTADFPNILFGGAGGGGGPEFVFTNVDADFTAAVNDFVLADTTLNCVTVLLPAASASAGGIIAAKKIAGTNVLALRAAGADSIDGHPSVGVVRTNSELEVISAGGSSWWIL